MKLLKHSFRGLALLMLASAFLIVGTVHTAFAAGVVGNGTPASCTEAAFDSVLASQSDNITFNCGAAVKTITLTTTKAIDWQTVIDGGNKIILQAQNVRHFLIDDPKEYMLKNITLTNGGGEEGGAIYNAATLWLVNVKFENNQSQFGGAIRNSGALNIRKSTFTNNRAIESGGAIYSEGGALTITNSTFTGNKTTAKESYGGALYLKDTTTTLDGGLMTQNASFGGSAIFKASGTFTVLGTKFTYNKAGGLAALYISQQGGFFKNILVDHNTATSAGGIYSESDPIVEDSTISNNIAKEIGGGIATVGGKLTLRGSTVSGNRAQVAAGIYLFGDFEIVQSTISANHAQQAVGGVWAGGNGSVANSTLSGNQTADSEAFGGAWYQGGYNADFTFVTVANNKASKGGGVYVASGDEVTMHIQNSLFANNTGGNCFGTAAGIGTRGHNLSDDTSCQNAFTAAGDLNKVNPKLGPLANNGGPTLTHLPGKGSKAIDGGTNLGVYQLDQRSYSRPHDGTSDIGAVETGSSQAE